MGMQNVQKLEKCWSQSFLFHFWIKWQYLFPRMFHSRSQWNASVSIKPKQLKYSMACRKKIPCAVCRLPIVDGKDEAILCEGRCQQWYHRGCASLPPDRYKELSSTDAPFCCLTCTCLAFKEEMSALSSTVTSLREELQAANTMRESISALKCEVSTLKKSLKDALRKLEEAKQHKRPLLQPHSYADATKLNKLSMPAETGLFIVTDNLLLLLEVNGNPTII